jgi:hypothetical protein
LLLQGLCHPGTTHSVLICLPFLTPLTLFFLLETFFSPLNSLTWLLRYWFMVLLCATLVVLQGVHSSSLLKLYLVFCLRLDTVDCLPLSWHCLCPTSLWRYSLTPITLSSSVASES